MRKLLILLHGDWLFTGRFDIMLTFVSKFHIAGKIERL
jgi:hypothetical protein